MTKSICEREKDREVEGESTKSKCRRWLGKSRRRSCKGKYAVGNEAVTVHQLKDSGALELNQEKRDLGGLKRSSDLCM